MPEIGNDSVFFQADASNSTGTPPSWLGSAAPSTLDDSGRALQGAIKREWAWRNLTVTAGGTADAKTLTYSVAPAAYYTGQQFAFIANTTNTTTCTLNVNALGAKTIKKDVVGTMTVLAASDMPSGTRVIVMYDGTDIIWVNWQGADPTKSTTTQVLDGTDTATVMTPDSAAALWEAGADVSSGAAIVVGDGGFFNLITSTVAITSFTVTTSKVGRTFRCRFNTARTLTQNAVSLILPAAASITTALGDIAQFRDLGSGNVVCEWYTKTDGTALVAASAATASSQAEQEAGSSTAVFTTPGRQHFHPSAAKFWAKWTKDSTTVLASYNLTSVADTATGRATLTIATDFSSAHWAIVSSMLDTSNAEKFTSHASQAAGTAEVQCYTSGGALVDPGNNWFSAGFGDQT